MRLFFHILFVLITAGNLATAGQVFISQYVDTDFGTSPKGIELFNAGPGFDLSSSPIHVYQYTNANLDPKKVATLDSGFFASGMSYVIGTEDIGNYMKGSYIRTPFLHDNLTFNGNDALEVRVGGVVSDLFGSIGQGLPWYSTDRARKVRSFDVNLAIRPGISSGNPDGFSFSNHIGSRFDVVSYAGEGPSGVSVLGGLSGDVSPSLYSGFGQPPIQTGASGSAGVTPAAIDAVSRTISVIVAVGLGAVAIFGVIQLFRTVKRAFFGGY
jgi:hypothetical protein